MEALDAIIAEMKEMILQNERALASGRKILDACES